MPSLRNKGKSFDWSNQDRGREARKSKKKKAEAVATVDPPTPDLTKKFQSVNEPIGPTTRRQTCLANKKPSARPRCLHFGGAHRRLLFPAADFCGKCDLVEQDILLGDKRHKPESTRNKCEREHNSFVFPYPYGVKNKPPNPHTATVTPEKQPRTNYVDYGSMFEDSTVASSTGDDSTDDDSDADSSDNERELVDPPFSFDDDDSVADSSDDEYELVDPPDDDSDDERELVDPPDDECELVDLQLQ
jgi:hypothetical protein